ncbi:TPA: hypothetical protein ACYQQZ_005034, partial [Escherichia coli]
MDIAVIGSNMVDLITYTNQMPKEGETLEAPAFGNDSNLLIVFYVQIMPDDF